EGYHLERRKSRAGGGRAGPRRRTNRAAAPESAQTSANLRTLRTIDGASPPRTAFLHEPAFWPRTKHGPREASPPGVRSNSVVRYRPSDRLIRWSVWGTRLRTSCTPSGTILLPRGPR